MSLFGLSFFGLNQFGLSHFGLDQLGLSLFGLDQFGLSLFGLYQFGLTLFGLWLYQVSFNGQVISRNHTFGHFDAKKDISSHFMSKHKQYLLTNMCGHFKRAVSCRAYGRYTGFSSNNHGQI